MRPVLDVLGSDFLAHMVIPRVVDCDAIYLYVRLYKICLTMADVQSSFVSHDARKGVMPI